MKGRGAARWHRAAIGAVVMLLAVGCGSASRPARQPGSGPDASPAAGARAAAGSARRRELAAAYLKIAMAGNRRLETDFGRLAGRDHGHRAAADLRDAAATERLFDRRLLRLRLPPATEFFARFLVWANQARATLSGTAASSVSLRQLARYRQRLDAANVPVEQAVTIIRHRLGLPPPETS